MCVPHHVGQLLACPCHHAGGPCVCVCHHCGDICGCVSASSPQRRPLSKHKSYDSDCPVHSCPTSPRPHQNLGHFVTSPSSSHLPLPVVTCFSMVGGKWSHPYGHQSCTCQALTLFQVYRCGSPVLSLDCRPQLSSLVSKYRFRCAQH